MMFEKFLYNSLFNKNGNYVRECTFVRNTTEFQTIVKDLNVSTCNNMKQTIENMARIIIPNVDSINKGRLLTLLCLLQHVLLNCVLRHSTCDFNKTIRDLSSSCNFLNSLLIPNQCIILCNFMNFVNE